MVFSSIPFVYAFFPLVAVAYSLSKNRVYRNVVLLLASLLFYSWGEPRFLLLMLAATLAAYCGGLLMERSTAHKRLILIVTVVLLVGNLFVFKYLNFFSENLSALFGWRALPKLTLPIGISFYTFQILSYVIDLYRGEIRVQRNYFYLLLYVSFFPQLIAGPIVKYHDIEQEIDSRRTTPQETALGIRRFICGLSKKLLLSNALGQMADTVFALPAGEIGMLAGWTGAICYTLQIYFDFSGYSDMAIGLGRMFGFHFRENFNYPYTATTIKEFWRRWHISLSGWFRDYLYIPLGGSRCSRKRMIFNLLVVWLATGLWHGAHLNFLLWGLGLFVILTVEKLWLKKYLDRWPVLGHLYMLVLIPLSWAVFSVPDLGQLGAYFGRLLPLFSHTAAAYPLDFLKYGKTYGVFLVLGLVCSTSLPAYLYRRLKGTWAGAVILAVLFWLCLFCLSKGMNDPFMYFRF